MRIVNSFCTFLPHKLIARNALRNYIVKFNFQISFVLCWRLFAVCCGGSGGCCRWSIECKTTWNYNENQQLDLHTQTIEIHAAHLEHESVGDSIQCNSIFAKWFDLVTSRRVSKNQTNRRTMKLKKKRAQGFLCDSKINKNWTKNLKNLLINKWKKSAQK